VRNTGYLGEFIVYVYVRVDIARVHNLVNSDNIILSIVIVILSWKGMGPEDIGLPLLPAAPSSLLPIRTNK
jgi:hypothetical protein